MIQEQLQQARREMFAHRNGIVAEALRRGGDPHRVITGCQIADLNEIARLFAPDASLAEALWTDVNHRECRLLAPMLMPREACTLEVATRWVESLVSAEEADVLCHRLLQHIACARELHDRWHVSDTPLSRYCRRRLAGWIFDED